MQEKRHKYTLYILLLLLQKWNTTIQLKLFLAVKILVLYSIPRAKQCKLDENEVNYKGKDLSNLSLNYL